ncbi:MAG TPA: pro-sigmaK processing inhibitor BofA family protein [Bacilli bacterium]
MWLYVFIISLALLLILLFKAKLRLRYFGYLLLNVVAAGFLLIVVNYIGGRYALHIPVNITTLLTVSILGLPGLVLLIALKLTLF